MFNLQVHIYRLFLCQIIIVIEFILSDSFVRRLFFFLEVFRTAQCSLSYMRLCVCHVPCQLLFGDFTVPNNVMENIYLAAFAALPFVRDENFPINANIYFEIE